MVDFPEGYGFAPNHGARIMQDKFLVDIGIFSRSMWMQVSRSRSPYHFEPIGLIQKDSATEPCRGILFGGGNAPIEGALQQVVTALCTLHRMRGGMT